MSNQIATIELEENGDAKLNFEGDPVKLTEGIANLMCSNLVVAQIFCAAVECFKINNKCKCGGVFKFIEKEGYVCNECGLTKLFN